MLVAEQNYEKYVKTMYTNMVQEANENYLQEILEFV